MTTSPPVRDAQHHPQDHKRIVKYLESALERGPVAWGCSSDRLSGPMQGRPHRPDGTPYRGFNCAKLMLAQAAHDHGSSLWMTQRQAERLGGTVRLDANPEQVRLFFRITDRKRTDDQPDRDREGRFAVRWISVFNAGDIDGMNRYQATRTERDAPESQAVLLEAERHLRNTGATIMDAQQATPCYCPTEDVIRMPSVYAFASREAYVATLSHEVIHWTGAKHRLNRTRAAQFGDPAYAFEELVAEVGSALLCADLRIAPTPRVDHAPYLAGWLKLLKHHPQAFLRAASLAERAARFVHEVAGRRPVGA